MKLPKNVHIQVGKGVVSLSVERFLKRLMRHDPKKDQPLNVVEMPGDFYKDPEPRKAA